MAAPAAVFVYGRIPCFPAANDGVLPHIYQADNTIWLLLTFSFRLGAIYPLLLLTMLLATVAAVVAMTTGFADKLI